MIWLFIQAVLRAVVACRRVSGVSFDRIGKQQLCQEKSGAGGNFVSHYRVFPLHTMNSLKLLLLHLDWNEMASAYCYDRVVVKGIYAPHRFAS